MSNLTISNIERQNVLNNKYALAKIQESIGIDGMEFEGEYRFTKKMVAEFFKVEERTIERYIEQYSEELTANGYFLCKGKKLKELKLQFAPVINVGSKTSSKMYLPPLCNCNFLKIHDALAFAYNQAYIQIFER